MVNKTNAINFIVTVSIVLLLIYFIYHRQVNSQDQDQVNSQETKREILCVEYADTVNNVCEHGVDPELWTVVDHSTQFGVVYFCQ